MWRIPPPVYGMLIELLRRLRPTRLIRWLSCLVVLSILWVWVNYTKLYEYFETREQLYDLSSSVQRLESQQNKLDKEQHALKNGGFQAEKAIREQFFMVRKGERLLVIESPDEITGFSNKSP
jgi:cell division protein FtsB